MGKPGGRPKAEDIWEHVMVLAGGKQVECKYCKFIFAASANRIKSHIHRIEGKGVRICPKSEKIMRDLKEKEDLPDSQGLPIVDKSRDYNKPHEKILDCYMFPETMCEGIKAIQPVHTNNEAIHHERIEVGPFYVSNSLNECDLQLIRYVFEHSRCKVFSSPRSFLDLSDFTTLKPETHLDSWVINVFADILTDIEKRKESKPFNWYLPETFSRVSFVEKQKMRENYMFGDLKYCEKIFIPVHVEKNNCGHYYLYIIHMKNWEVEIWDSLCPSFLDEPERAKKTQKLLCAMEELFGKVIMFTKFDSRMATNILSQPNGHDCGIFVINYMLQSDNYVRQNPSFQFDSDKERLDLALKLIKNDLNGEKEELYKAARSYAKGQSEEALDLCSSKRKPLDTCKTVVGDVEGRGADMELDDSDNRDEKRKNVGLKTAFLFESMWSSPLDAVRNVILSDCLGIRGAILPKDINELIVSGCDHWTRTTSLCRALSFQTNNSIDVPRIKMLKVIKSNKLEYLCCMSAHCSFCHCVQLVGTLFLFGLKDLKQILAPHTTPPWASPFVHLSYLQISECSSMKIVITPGLLAQLQNLATMCVGWCKSMEEIVGENYCSENTSNPTIITLPKLTSVRLICLPKLNSVFRGTMFCPFLKSFKAFKCEKLSPPDIEIVKGHKLHLEIRRGEWIWPYDRIEEEEEEDVEEEPCEGLNGDWPENEAWIENEDLNGDWIEKWIAEFKQ